MPKESRPVTHLTDTSPEAADLIAAIADRFGGSVVSFELDLSANASILATIRVELTDGRADQQIIERLCAFIRENPTEEI